MQLSDAVIRELVKYRREQELKRHLSPEEAKQLGRFSIDISAMWERLTKIDDPHSLPVLMDDRRGGITYASVDLGRDARLGVISAQPRETRNLFGRPTAILELWAGPSQRSLIYPDRDTLIATHRCAPDAISRIDSLQGYQETETFWHLLHDVCDAAGVEVGDGGSQDA